MWILSKAVIRYIIALWFFSCKAIFRLIPVLYFKPILQTFCQCNFSNDFYIILLFCKFTPLSIINSMLKSAYFILLCCSAIFLDSTSPCLSKLLLVYLLALIIPINHLTRQIFTSYTSPKLLISIFYKRLFYILSDVLVYIQAFSIA